MSKDVTDVIQTYDEWYEGRKKPKFYRPEYEFNFGDVKTPEERHVHIYLRIDDDSGSVRFKDNKHIPEMAIRFNKTDTEDQKRHRLGRLANLILLEKCGLHIPVVLDSRMDRYISWEIVGKDENE